MVILDQNNQVLNETSGNVRLQFDSEYKIRLRNKNDFAILASVTIDGRSITQGPNSGVIIESNGKIELERWIDNISTGNKFKFVSINHPEAQDPFDSNNGIIKVDFYREKKHKMYMAGPTIKPYIDPYTYPPIIDKQHTWDFPGTFYCNSNSGLSQRGSCIGQSILNDSGCTINGSKSDQKFSYTDKVFENFCFTSMSMKIKGINKSSVNVSSINYCAICGKRRKKTDNFCSKCGNNFIR